MTDVDLIKNSVTRDDAIKAPAGALPLTVMIGPMGYTWGGLLEGIKGATGLPPWGSKQRDGILSESPLVEDMWAAALNLAITKQTALGFRIEDAGQSDRRVKAAQEMLLQFDGDYVKGLGRHLRDFYTTNNGAFVEIVRASKASGSRVVGLMHLDSLRCYRTGDPSYPVVYLDWRGGAHRLPAENVLLFTDMPSARQEHYGLGQCAADRSWQSIIKRAAVELYFREKVSGTRNLALHFITGVNAEKLKEALNSSEEAQNQRGFVVYRGSTIIPMLGGGGSEAPQLITIPLAEIPDGFDPEIERRTTNQVFANNLGIPVQDIQPLSGQGLGTGTQSVILDEAAQGHGAAAWRRQWQQAITHRVLPSSTTFYFDTNDIRDKKAKAEVFSSMAGAVGGLVTGGVLSPQAALNVLVDAGLLDRAYLPTDVTPGSAVQDIDKADEGDVAAPESGAPALPPPPPAAPAAPVAEKAAVTVDDVWDKSEEWARLALEGDE